MDTELKAYLDERFGEIDQRAKEMEQRLERRIESTETKLLTAFLFVGESIGYSHSLLARTGHGA